MSFPQLVAFLAIALFIGDVLSYRMVKRFYTYQEAQAYCGKHGWNLVSVVSEDVQNELNKLARRHLRPGLTYWIGLTSYQDGIGKWKTADCKPSNFFNWDTGFPTNSISSYCATAESSFGKWMDEDCSIQRPFICNNETKMEADCTIMAPDLYTLNVTHRIWYKMISTQKTQAELEAICVADGAHLATIESMEKNKFLESLMEVRHRTYVGLYFDETTRAMQWLSNKPVNFTNFFKGEPNNHKGGEYCVELSFYGDGTWNDISCYLKLSAICERPAF